MTFLEAITKYDRIRLNWWEGHDYIYVRHYADGKPYLDSNCDNLPFDELASETLENYFTDNWEEYKE